MGSIARHGKHKLTNIVVVEFYLFWDVLKKYLQIKREINNLNFVVTADLLSHRWLEANIINKLSFWVASVEHRGQKGRDKIISILCKQLVLVKAVCRRIWRETDNFCFISFSLIQIEILTEQISKLWVFVVAFCHSC